jgi:hypothetical protein
MPNPFVHLEPNALSSWRTGMSDMVWLSIIIDSTVAMPIYGAEPPNKSLA